MTQTVLLYNICYICIDRDGAGQYTVVVRLHGTTRTAVAIVAGGGLDSSGGGGGKVVSQGADRVVAQRLRMELGQVHEMMSDMHEAISDCILYNKSVVMSLGVCTVTIRGGRVQVTYSRSEVRGIVMREVYGKKSPIEEAHSYAKHVGVFTRKKYNLPSVFR